MGFQDQALRKKAWLNWLGRAAKNTVWLPGVVSNAKGNKRMRVGKE